MFKSKQVVELKSGRRLEIFLLESGETTKICVFYPNSKQTNGNADETHHKSYAISVEQAIQDYGQGQAIASNTNHPLSQ